MRRPVSLSERRTTLACGRQVKKHGGSLMEGLVISHCGLLNGRWCGTVRARMLFLVLEAPVLKQRVPVYFREI